MKKFVAVGIFAVAVVIGASCSKTAVVEYRKYKDDADVPRIAVADAKKEFDAGTAVIIDSRADAAYKQEHIEGSINIPIGTPESSFADIPTGKKIIVYCS